MEKGREREREGKESGFGWVSQKIKRETAGVDQ